MKKLFVSLITAVLFASFSTFVIANSGPVYWNGYPSTEMFSIDENSPIQVTGENLIFDFLDQDNFSNTVTGKVTASYEMANPTAEVQSVQMAFPFVGRPDHFKPNDIVIKADQQVLAYDLYFGNEVNSYVNSSKEDQLASFDFEKIVSSITYQPYKAKNFSENEIGKLYSIDVKPTTDERVNILIDFQFNSEKTKIFTKGFNSYGYNGQTTEISAFCFEPMTLEIFVLGEDIDFNISGSLAGKIEEKTDLFAYEISTNEVGVKPYILNLINNSPYEEMGEVAAEQQLYNLYAKAFDHSFAQYMGYSSEYDLLEKVNNERIFTVVYTVEFPPDSKKEVSVSYEATGTMDKRNTVTPLYTFDYILNPARNWDDFKNLKIMIITPEQAPHIVESNIKLEKQANNVYIVNLAELPNNDFSFTLYANEEITVVDNIKGSLSEKFGVFVAFLIGISILVITGALLLIRRWRTF